MKKLIYGLLLIGFFSCKKTNPKTEKLNQLSESQFEIYLLDNLEHKKEALIYIDSLVALPTLKNDHKGIVYLWKMSWAMVQKDYKTALESSDKIYEINEGKQSALLVSNYYILGRLQELQNKHYQALYYYNKAGEILKQTTIYNTTPMKADVLLLRIAKKNKSLGLNELANWYLQAALAKNKINDYKPKDFDYQYNTLKASMFSSVTMLNKDSLDYYLSEAEKSTVMLNHKINNKMYIKSEYFFNNNQLDSSLYYLNKVSKDFQARDVNDELNLLTIYSRQNKIKQAEKVLYQIEEEAKIGKLNASDSLLYLGNIIDYHIAKKDFPRIKKSMQKHMVFREKFNDKETRKNINELSSVLDLQYKDKEIERANKKYLKSVQTRNRIIVISAFLLLIGTIIGLYFRNKATKKRLLLEKNEIDLKMKLLQSQINPHFIFNTLGAIQSLIRQEKNDESINYLNKFSGLLRQTLNLSRDKQTTLEKELQVLKSYVEVQQLRKSNFDVTINLSDEVSDLQSEIVMPTLSLQPFVENAILHGFKGIDYQGKVQITVTCDKYALYINIKDNGLGLQPKKQTERTSHGIEIIKEQFEILGKAHRFETAFSVKNRTDKSGVVVTITIPLIVSTFSK